MNLISKKGFVLLSLFVFTTFADIGQSAIITLIFPYGARSTGMGEVGTALSSDGSASYYNPANLGVENEDWKGGLLHAFGEPLLPTFEMEDLWHVASSGIFQKRGSDGILHGIGWNYNYLSFGTNLKTDEKGRVLDTFRSYEYVIGVSYATLLENRRYRDIAIGFNVKYAVSALDHTTDGGTARTFAIDAGALWKYKYGILVGLNLQNMGPSAYYTSYDNRDPIPFAVRLGLGYEKDLMFENLRFLQVKFGYDIERECVRNDNDKSPQPFFSSIITSWLDQDLSEELSEIVHHVGGEITFFNIARFRTGFLIDPAGSRKELNWGMGVNIFNHLEFNYSYIHSPQFSEARDGQWRIDLSIKRIANWSREDGLWFLKLSE